MNVVPRPEAHERRTGELVITRDIAAPRAAVFQAWTDPKRAALWWAPGNVTLLSCKMDVRPGGHWQRRMRNGAGELFVKRGTYREVLAPEKLVFTYTTDYESGAVDPETVVSLTFVELAPRKTRLTLWQTGFDNEATRESHTGGWTSAVERLAGFVASNPG